MEIRARGANRLSTSKVAPDHTVVADLALAAALSNRDVDRSLVDIQPHEHDTFRD